VTIDIAREQPPVDDGGSGAPDESAHPVFTAHLQLALPRLGALHVSLRLAGNSVATRIAGSDPQRLRAQMDALAAQFEARGLQPVSLQAVDERGGEAA
jgi:hypothetical protein